MRRDERPCAVIGPDRVLPPSMSRIAGPSPSDGGERAATYDARPAAYCEGGALVMRPRDCAVEAADCRRLAPQQHRRPDAYVAYASRPAPQQPSPSGSQLHPLAPEPCVELEYARARYEPYARVADKYAYAGYEYAYRYPEAYRPPSCSQPYEPYKKPSSRPPEPTFYRFPYAQPYAESDYRARFVRPRPAQVAYGAVDPTSQRYANDAYAKYKYALNGQSLGEPTPYDGCKPKPERYAAHYVGTPYANYQYAGDASYAHGYANAGCDYSYKPTNFQFTNVQYQGVPAANAQYPNAAYHARQREFAPPDRTNEWDAGYRPAYGSKYVPYDAVPRPAVEFPTVPVYSSAPSGAYETPAVGQCQTYANDPGYASRLPSVRRQNFNVTPNPKRDFYYGGGYDRVPIPHVIEPSANVPKSACGPKPINPGKPAMDLRQFLETWDEEYEDPKVSNIESVETDKRIANVQTREFTSIGSNHVAEQLYVLDKIMITNEQLPKYEHIQKVTKLPDFIKDVDLVGNFRNVPNVENKMNSCVQYHKIPTDVDKPSVSSIDRSKPKTAKSDFFANEMIDVESKISQSVIHKDVGCNFEIKPCSPGKSVQVRISNSDPKNCATSASSLSNNSRVSDRYGILKNDCYADNQKIFNNSAEMKSNIEKSVTNSLPLIDSVEDTRSAVLCKNVEVISYSESIMEHERKIDRKSRNSCCVDNSASNYEVVFPGSFNNKKHVENDIKMRCEKDFEMHQKEFSSKQILNSGISKVDPVSNIADIIDPLNVLLHNMEKECLNIDTKQQNSGINPKSVKNDVFEFSHNTCQKIGSTKSLQYGLNNSNGTVVNEVGNVYPGIQNDSSSLEELHSVTGGVIKFFTTEENKKHCTSVNLSHKTNCKEKEMNLRIEEKTGVLNNHCNFGVNDCNNDFFSLKNPPKVHPPLDRLNVIQPDDVKDYSYKNIELYQALKFETDFKESKSLGMPNIDDECYVLNKESTSNMIESDKLCKSVDQSCSEHNMILQSVPQKEYDSFAESKRTEDEVFKLSTDIDVSHEFKYDVKEKVFEQNKVISPKLLREEIENNEIVEEYDKNFSIKSSGNLVISEKDKENFSTNCENSETLCTEPTILNETFENKSVETELSPNLGEMKTSEDYDSKSHLNNCDIKMNSGDQNNCIKDVSYDEEVASIDFDMNYNNMFDYNVSENENVHQEDENCISDRLEPQHILFKNEIITDNKPADESVSPHNLNDSMDVENDLEHFDETDINVLDDSIQNSVKSNIPCQISEDENENCKSYSPNEFINLDSNDKPMKHYESYLIDDSFSDDNNFNSCKTVMLCGDQNSDDDTGDDSMSSCAKERIDSSNLDINGLEIGGCWIDDIACVETVVSEENNFELCPEYNAPGTWKNFNTEDCKSTSLVVTEQENFGLLKDSNENVIIYSTIGSDKNKVIFKKETTSKDVLLDWEDTSSSESHELHSNISNLDDSSNSVSDVPIKKLYWNKCTNIRKETKKSKSKKKYKYIEKEEHDIFTGNAVEDKHILDTSIEKTTIKTKGAQKYIPSNSHRSDKKNLKCHLSLPKDKLLSLKKQNIDANEVNEASSLSNCSVNRMVLPKKTNKPRFEDVLRSIDETNSSIIKMKLKRAKKKKLIPKVVIKKDEQGSHYSSIVDKNCDSDTADKWQPQVYLCRSSSIEDLVKYKSKSENVCKYT